jgi:hypothetical protein
MKIPKTNGVDLKSLNLKRTKIDLTQAVLIAEADGAVCGGLN